MTNNSFIKGLKDFGRTTQDIMKTIVVERIQKSWSVLSLTTIFFLEKADAVSQHEEVVVAPDIELLLIDNERCHICLYALNISCR